MFGKEAARGAGRGAKFKKVLRDVAGTVARQMSWIATQMHTIYRCTYAARLAMKLDKCRTKTVMRTPWNEVGATDLFRRLELG